MHSSTQESSKEYELSTERESFSKQPEQHGQNNLGFLKMKKEDQHIFTHQHELGKVKNYNSQKIINYKPDYKNEMKPKKSP